MIISMPWWKQNRVSAIVVILILLLLVQAEWFDVFNATIRATTNLLVFGFYGTSVLFALAIVILLSYFFSSQKKPAAH